MTDDISDELLESLPELGSGRGGVSAFPPLPTFGVGPSALGGESDLIGALSDVRRSMEAAFQHEMDRLESSFGAILRQTEARLVQANLELAAARAEHDRTKQEHARKSLALRELKRALEGL